MRTQPVVITIEHGAKADRDCVQAYIFDHLQWLFLLVREQRTNGQFVIEAFPVCDPMKAMG